MRISFQSGQPSHAKPAEPQDVAPPAVHDRSIGDLLRGAQRLNDLQVEQVLNLQRERGLRFGEAAVALRLVTDDDVLWALSQQFHYPYAPQNSTQRNPELVVSSDPFSHQAEVFRDLCSQVAARTEEGGRTRHAVCVVSPESGDGKTFLAANLAVAFSQVGGRTLLVDADMRTPRQHELFGVDSSSGLSAVLAGRTSTSAIRSIPDLPSLFVMPAGAVPPNPMELLQRPAFGLLMQELLVKFDHVVVDTPNFARSADARVIASRCGAAISVGRRGRTRISQMNRLAGTLAAVRTALVGVVMNNH